jgi:hypothetical protein
MSIQERIGGTWINLRDATFFLRGEREEGSLADGPISSSVMIWAVFCTAFAMPCLALAALFWRATHDAPGVKSLPRLSAKYRFRLNKPGAGAARIAPKQRRGLKRTKH